MSGHIPVMLSEVLEAAAPQDGDVIIDGTFGGGGYSKAFLDKADCTIIAIDQDPSAFKRARDLAKALPGKIFPIHGRFSEMENHLNKAGFDQANCIVLDIGVSSYQIDQAARGFSFAKDGPLDMRMDSSIGQTAADIVNSYAEKDLADLLYHYGEERQSRKIAKAIYMRRQETPFARTSDLAELIEKTLGKHPKDKIHPATRSFQALRIAVNDELGELEKGLQAAEDILAEGGRLVVVTFHSLEDRIVKDFFKDKSGQSKNTSSRFLPVTEKNKNTNSFKLLIRKAIQATELESKKNPRARSAKLRWGIKTKG